MVQLFLRRCNMSVFTTCSVSFLLSILEDKDSLKGRVIDMSQVVWQAVRNVMIFLFLLFYILSSQ